MFAYSVPVLVLALGHLVFSTNLADQAVLDVHLKPSLPISDLLTANAEFSPQGHPLEIGFVAFGDSYAGGVGTGKVTTGAPCRVGQSAYPSLLNATADHFVFYESHACTGARTDALLAPGGQIDSWYATHLADFATLSVGGDDLDFAVILDACVLRYAGAHSPNCEEWVQRARETMSGGLDAKLFETTARIFRKGQPELELYWTGYPRFFNAETNWCDNTTFWFWQPGHHWNAARAGDWAYLTKERRKMLNDLVDELNALIRRTIWLARRMLGQTGIHFIDPNPAFQGHRFCDVYLQGGVEVEEPAAANKDTWFFLSSWPDNFDRLPNGLQPPIDAREVIEPERPLSMSLASNDDESCVQRYKRNRNRTEYTACSIAVGAELIRQSRETEDQKHDVGFSEDAQRLLESLDSDGVRWYWPTEWIKSFHPKSMGHNAYKDEIIRLWKLGQEKAYWIP